MANKISSYVEALKSPKWQRKRLEVMQRDNFTCVRCQDTETTLNVHHKEYHRNKKPWEYEAEFLETLCETCHKKEHKKSDKRLTDEQFNQIYNHPSKFTDPKAAKRIINERAELQEQLRVVESYGNHEAVEAILRSIMELDRQKLALRKVA